jgi:two-component system, NtrC family, response regulator AtoC
MRGSGPSRHAGDATTQLDLGAQRGQHDERAYVMWRVGDQADVRAVDEGDTLVFGRADDADFRTDDSRVSRRHAELTLRGGRLSVKDLGSRNGTRVGERVLRLEERELRRGDEIAVGAGRATVVAVPAVEALPLGDVIAADARTQALFALVERLAQVPSSVLVRGETGAGKEIVAEQLHRRGPRRHGPLVRLNCAAVPESLIESELFGHVRGAFTGAHEDKRGYLELAHGGTLFLDEIGELPLAMQAKLLRALESQRFQRVGGASEIAVDVRFVCATNRDLEAMAARGAFRSDLFYRVAGFVVDVPPLRERRADILPLAARFASSFAAAIGQPAPAFGAEAQAALLAHAWPGNVRELKNAVEHAVVLAGGATIGAEHFPPAVRLARAAPASMQDHVDSAERAAIEKALADTGGHRGRAAELLGVSKRTLQYRLAKLGMKA